MTLPGTVGPFWKNGQQTCRAICAATFDLSFCPLTNTTLSINVVGRKLTAYKQRQRGNMGSFKSLFINAVKICEENCHRKKTDRKHFSSVATVTSWRRDNFEKIVSRQCKKEKSVLLPRICLLIFYQTTDIK